MKKLIAILILAMCSVVHAADTKLTALTKLASGNDDLLLYCVTDPNGSPLDRKIPWEELILPWDGTINIITLGTIATGVWEGTAIADGYVLNNITIDLATLATTLTITDNENTAENNPLVFVAGADPDGGDLGLETDGDAHYNPSTGTITATEFVGGGSGLTLASTDLSDSAALLYETELDDFSELDTQIADKTLVNEEDAVTWDALGTFGLGVTITTGDPLTLGIIRWDNGSDLIDGERIAADTIDNDSIDWADMTDLGTDGVVTWGNLAAGELTNDSINDDDINWGDIANLGAGGAVTLAATVTVTDDEATDDDQEVVFTTDNVTLESDGDFHYSPDTGTVTATEFVGGGAGLTALAGTNITANTINEPALETTNAAGVGTDDYLLSYNHAGTNFTWVASVGGGTMSSFIAEDGDGTEVEIDDLDEWKFVEGAGIDIDWTDVSDGTDGDPFDLTFTVELGTTISAAEMANEDHGDVQWNGGDADVESMDLGDATTGTYYLGLFADDTGTSRPIYADAPLSYAQGTGTLSATEFSGGGGSLTGVDAATGDSATDFFDAGALHDDRVPNNITIDLATRATTVTLADDDTTNDNHDIVFTTDIAGAVNLEADIGDFHYNPSTGTVTATEFAGGGSGITSVDAITGDSATAFFDAGTIEHERGGLQADVSSYTGLIAITGADTTAEIDSKTELEGQIADVSDFAEADGDVFTGDHDFGGADLELPQGQTPDTDGDIDLDFTDGKLVIQHGSAHTELAGSTDVVMGTLIKSWSGTIIEPDGVNDVFTIKAINSVEYPHGVVITAIYLGISEDTGYVLTVQNFDDFDTINGGNPTIDTVTYSADTTGEIIDSSPTFDTIAAGQIIMISIPVTDVDWIHFEIYYYEPIS